MNFKGWDTGLVDAGKQSEIEAYINNMNVELAKDDETKLQTAIDKRLFELFKKHKSGENISDALDELVVEILPIVNERDKSWEMGAQNFLKGCILALFLNTAIKMPTITKVKKISGIGNFDENRVTMLREYFKAQPEECRILVDSVVTNSENTARNFLGALYISLARI